MAGLDTVETCARRRRSDTIKPFVVARSPRRHCETDAGRLRAVTFEEPAGSANWVTAEAKAGLLNEEITDVAFTSATHKMFPGGLEALFAEHRFGDAVPLGAHWAHKYLVDLDGMGYSGRFMAFLESDSVPVKSSVYKEFYSDWIE